MNTQELANELHKEAVWSEFLPGSQAGLMIRASRELARLAEVNAELLEALELFLDATEGTACVEAKDGYGEDAWPKLAAAGRAARDARTKAKEQK